MNQNEHNSFKEEVELFIQMITIENQFERLLEAEPIYYVLSKREQELIYEEFKKLLSLKSKRDEKLINDYFFDERKYEDIEPNYCKSKLYQSLLNRYYQEQMDNVIDLCNEFQKLTKNQQQRVAENIKRLVKNR